MRRALAVLLLGSAVAGCVYSPYPYGYGYSGYAYRPVYAAPPVAPDGYRPY